LGSTFSDYVKRTVPFLGGTVDLEIRALDKKEAPDFQEKVRGVQTRWASEHVRKEGETDEQYAPRVRVFFEEVDRFCEEVFSRTIETKNGTKGYFVRLPEPLVNEDDETRTIKDVCGLFSRGGRMFGLAILMEIASLAEVDPLMGKGSSSPSTSTVVAGPPSSEDPATTTEELVSPRISIAPETLTFPVPSSGRG
jgi:hypothetical protein